MWVPAAGVVVPPPLGVTFTVSLQLVAGLRTKRAVIVLSSPALIAIVVDLDDVLAMPLPDHLSKR